MQFLRWRSPRKLRARVARGTVCGVKQNRLPQARGKMASGDGGAGMAERVGQALEFECIQHMASMHGIIERLVR